jgi:hypothetical protein
MGRKADQDWPEDLDQNTNGATPARARRSFHSHYPPRIAEMKTITTAVSAIERKVRDSLALLQEVPAPVLRLPVISHEDVLHILDCEMPASCETCIRRAAR